MSVLNLVLLFTQPFSIAVLLSSIAANQLILSLRGVYYSKHLENTTVATTNSKPVYNLRALNQFREHTSTFSALLSHPETVDTAVGEENYDWREPAV